VLSEADLTILEGELLPALERHHLRLLAHSLRCLQQAVIAEAGEADPPGGSRAPLPDADALTGWAERQPGLLADAGFIPVLVEQLLKAKVQLQEIGLALGKPPLALEMSDLVAWARASADRRLADQDPTLRPPDN
jgi:hypothetical protein